VCCTSKRGDVQLEWFAVVLILGIIGVVAVALVGGRTRITTEGIEFNSEGLINSLQQAKESKGIASSPPPPREEAERLIQRTREVSHSLPVATILWVDDKPLNNLAERRAFAALGIFCDSYSRNEEALAALRYNGYDLVISDIGRGSLPETGWDLLDEVQAARPQTPFVFYTIDIDDSLKEQSSTRGASGIVEMPDKLIDTVLQLL
jgi:CheY-like chemotaxis protein